MNQPEKSKPGEMPQRRNWGCIAVGAIVFCVGLLGFMALLWSTANYFDCATLPAPFIDIEKDAYFKLPSSVQNIDYDSEVSGRNCTIWVTFQMDAGDLDTFQQSTLVESLEPIRLDENRFMRQKGWIQPVTSIAGKAQRSSNPLVFQQVYVDTTDKSDFVVYIIVRKEWL